MARKPAASQRAKRLSDLIQRELSMIFFQAYSNLREPGPTITNVEVANDLSMATIWVTQLDSDATKLEQTLNSKIGQWKKALAPALASLHKMPNLRFKYDLSIEHGLHINSLIAAAMAKTQASESAEKNASTEQSDEQSLETLQNNG